MDLDPSVLNELERLADIGRHEIRSQAWSSVSDRFTDELYAALAGMTEVMRGAGVDRITAEWATTIWFCAGQDQGWTVAQCLQHAEYHADIGVIHPER